MALSCLNWKVFSKNCNFTPVHEDHDLLFEIVVNLDSVAPCKRQSLSCLDIDYANLA